MGTTKSNKPKSIANSEAKSYVKELFPQLKWRHFLHNANLNSDPRYGVLVGENSYFHIRVELLPIGTLAELRIGYKNEKSLSRQYCLRMSENIQGTTLIDAVKPIKETWDEIANSFTN
ncbi:MAG: hypothetical protein WBB28_14640 [Crinalium sp.]